MENIKQYFEKQKEISSVSKNSILGLTTGLEKLDHATSGYKNKELNLIASRVGYGKTSLALTSVLANLDENNGVLYFSLDLSKERLLTRIISMKSNISLSKLEKGLIDNDEEGDIHNIIENISSQNLFIDDTKYCDIEYIKNKSNEMASNSSNNIKMIVIDYFDLIENDADTNIARELKKLAIKLDMPIVVLSQLSKKIEKRINQKPKLSDLKDSALEIEANTILFIYVDNFVQEHRECEKEIKSLMKGKNDPYKSAFFINPIVEAQINVAKQSCTLDFVARYDLCRPIASFKEQEIKEVNINLPDFRFDKMINELINCKEGYKYSEGLPFDTQEHEDIQVLDANELKLKKIPDEIFELNNLETLRVQNNKIKKISNSLENLTKLEALCLCDNELEIVPDTLIKLENLKELGICNNPKLKTLPDNFDMLKLTSLSISGDLINKYIDKIAKITTLKDLDIHGGYISKEVFKGLVNLPNLEELTLHKIENKKFPKNIGMFKKMEYLAIKASKKFKLYNNNINSNNFNNILSIRIDDKELVDNNAEYDH